MERSSLDRAIAYVHRGWCVIPIPYRSKNPDRWGWERLRLTEAELSRHFGRGPRNIGVLLGEPSGWLVDVDLDHELAVALAPTHLPPTGAVFGRRGKLRSHYLYIASQPAATRQWRLHNKKMVVELRSTGNQTLFPGSTHPKGEPIEWDIALEPAIVSPAELIKGITIIYAAVCRQLNMVDRLPTSKPFSAAAAPQSVLKRARRYLSKLPPAISGQGGHAATFKATCRLVIGFGLDSEQSLALMREWNESCQPPWSEKELVHKVDDALRQPGWRGYLLARSDRGVLQPASRAIDRATRHAIEHRRRALRRAHS